MNKVSLLECIEAISLGDVSFNTLRNVVIDGNLETNDYVWCFRGHAVFKIKIDNIPHLMKISLDSNSDKLHKNYDRCDAFYSNIFIKMETLFNELNIYSDTGINKQNVSIMLADFDKKIDSKYEFSKKFVNLTINILRTNLIIDNFSLKWCVNNGDLLKISLEKGGIIMPYRDIQPDMLIAFKNYLLSLISYIRYNYDEEKYEEFIENSHEFKLNNYKTYNNNNYAKLYIPATGTKAYNELISSLLGSTSRDYCAEILEPMVENIEEWWSNWHENKVQKSAYDIVTEKYDIHGDNIENRIAIIDKVTNKQGFMDEQCNIVIEAIYDNVSPFEEGIAVVSRDSRFGAINTYGETVINFEYDELEWDAHYNLYICLSNQLNGLITRSGDIILNPIHAWIDKFHNSLARYQDFKSNKFGYLNTNGEIIIEAIYDDASSFNEGFAKVRIEEQYFTIDVNGEKI